ncbi:hypothetical protein [Paraburkholderia bannensis]|uniref:hypothetical protein n=1 Tax=Paraburkholderia bannensis TaxID=765414 RepID=UPI002AC36A95|nr:hypothetical protein [Paraburkholderia bannensis]
MTNLFVSRLGGERTRACNFPCGQVLVDIRYSKGVTKLSDLDNVQTSGEIEIVVLASIERVADQLPASYTTLNDGDALVVFVANGELYDAAVNAFRLSAASKIG